MRMNWTGIWAVTAALVLHPMDAAAQSTRSLGKFNQWNVYLHEGEASRICFASTAPRTSEPADIDREVVQFFVSGWPREGIKSEVSVKLGYEVKPATPVSVRIGTTAFNLFAVKDRAFVANATDELKLIEALKKGSTMVVRATAPSGVQTSDTFSLAGVTQALQAMLSNCGS